MNFEIAPVDYWQALPFEYTRLYCFSLNIDGKTGWRLLSKEELARILSAPDTENYTLHWAQEADCHKDRMAHCVYNDGTSTHCVYNDGISHEYIYKTERVGTLPVRDLKDD
jgi:hypothetical protein